MRRIKIGNIGTLHGHSTSTMQTIKELSDIYEIVGFVPESDQRYNEIKDSLGYQGIKRMTLEELLSCDLDAVVIEGFEKEQVHYAKKCIEKGFHVQIDKPAGDNAEEFKELLIEAKKKNLIVHMGYMYRYNPSIVRAKQLSKEGKLGDIYSVEAHMSGEYNLSQREWLGNFKGGIMFYLGCHLVDLVYSFMGVPNEIIPLNQAIKNDKNAEDFGMAVFKYDRGVAFIKTTVDETGGFMRRQLVVCGTNGTVEIKPTERYVYTNGEEMLNSDIRVTLSDEINSAWLGQGKVETSKLFYRFNDMLIEFAKCIRGEMENPYSYEYELRLQMMLLASCGYDIDFKQKIEL